MMPVTVGESGESSFMGRGSFVDGGPMQESRASLGRRCSALRDNGFAVFLAGKRDKKESD